MSTQLHAHAFTPLQILLTWCLNQCGLDIKILFVMLSCESLWVILSMLEFNFILASILIFLCFIFIIIVLYQHRKEQWKIKFEPTINLNYNIYTYCDSTSAIMQFHLFAFLCLPRRRDFRILFSWHIYILR